MIYRTTHTSPVEGSRGGRTELSGLPSHVASSCIAADGSLTGPSSSSAGVPSVSHVSTTCSKSSRLLEYAGSQSSVRFAFSLDVGIGLVNPVASILPTKKRASPAGIRFGSSAFSSSANVSKNVAPVHGFVELVDSVARSSPTRKRPLLTLG